MEHERRGSALAIALKVADEMIVALLDLLRKADADDRADFVRAAVERLAQEVIDVEAQ